MAIILICNVINGDKYYRLNPFVKGTHIGRSFSSRCQPKMHAPGRVNLCLIYTIIDPHHSRESGDIHKIIFSFIVYAGHFVVWII